MSAHVTNQQIAGGCHRARIPSPQLNRGDGKAYKALLSDDTDPDLIPRLRDPALLNAFAALADDLRKVMDQIALGKDRGPSGRYCPLRALIEASDLTVLKAVSSKA